MLGENTPVSGVGENRERERETERKRKKRKRRKSSAVVTRNDALSHSWHETIIFSEHRGIERDPARRWRFIKRSRATLTRDCLPSSAILSSSSSSLSVRRGGERAASVRRRQNRSLPKVSPGGLACRNARCEPAITATRCHPEKGNFASKVRAGTRPGEPHSYRL